MRTNLIFLYGPYINWVPIRRSILNFTNPFNSRVKPKEICVVGHQLIRIYIYKRSAASGIANILYCS